MLNLNLASKISYERILNNFQNEAVNRSGVLMEIILLGRSRRIFRFSGLFIQIRRSSFESSFKSKKSNIKCIKEDPLINNSSTHNIVLSNFRPAIS